MNNCLLTLLTKFFYTPAGRQSSGMSGCISFHFMKRKCTQRLRPNIPTAHWFDSPLVRQPIGPTTVYVNGQPFCTAPNIKGKPHDINYTQHASVSLL